MSFLLHACSQLSAFHGACLLVSPGRLQINLGPSVLPAVFQSGIGGKAAILSAHDWL